MCGIAGIHRRTDKSIRLVNRLADSLILSIAHRGGDATGYLAMADDGSVQIEKSTKKAIQFVMTRKSVSAKSRTILLHTRFATQGRADDANNAHPVTAGKTAAIHNGTIYNDADLFEEYGMKRTAAVDSIVIPALVDHLGWDKAEKAIGKLYGGCATAIVNTDFPGELILARTASYPMHILITDDVIVWASERASIELAWKHVYGKQPVGEWVDLSEWTMMRVNGKVEIGKLARAPRKRLAIPSKKSSWPPAKVTKTTGSKRQRRKSARAQQQQLKMDVKLDLAVALDAVDNVDDVAVTKDMAVDDLISWAGCSYAEAYEEVHGYPAPTNDPRLDDVDVDDPYDWIDDILVPKKKRGKGWEVGL